MWAHQEEKFLQKKNDKACMVNYETALLTWISHHKDEDVKLLQIVANYCLTAGHRLPNWSLT